MRQRSRSERISAVATLAEPVRRALYDHVAASDSPVGRDAAAAALGLRRSTAAFHLDRLAAQGLLDVEYRRLGGRTGPGAGRPAKLYRRPDDEVAVSVPEREYDLVGRLLAGAIEESSRLHTPVGTALTGLARQTGRDIGARSGSLLAALDDHGFEPTHVRGGEVVLRNCPFHRLAGDFTALVCGLNLDLLSGVAEGAHDREHLLVLDPIPGRCCVRVLPADGGRQPV
ncbi:MAG: helix-turn-helix transcriptional regulator [Mycobacteriales bacterium]